MFKRVLPLVLAIIVASGTSVNASELSKVDDDMCIALITHALSLQLEYMIFWNGQKYISDEPDTDKKLAQLNAFSEHQNSTIIALDAAHNILERSCSDQEN